MLYVFYGDDRKKIDADVRAVLGRDFEVIEGENLTRGDMDSVFYGVSLFATERKILVKNLQDCKECLTVLPQYAKTPHRVVVWLDKLDKKTTLYKELEAAGVQTKKCEIEISRDEQFKAFNVYDEALRGNLKRALRLCDEMAVERDARMVLGALVSKAMTALEQRKKGAAEVLKILAEADEQMTNVDIDAWMILKIAVTKIAQK